MQALKTLLIVMAFSSVLSLITSCASYSVNGNENGSAPLNENEVADYKRAVLRCYKTGGTRVVKITGELRCFN